MISQQFLNKPKRPKHKLNMGLKTYSKSIKHRFPVLHMLKKALIETKKLRDGGANAPELLRYLHRHYPYLEDHQVWWIIEQVIKAA